MSHPKRIQRIRHELAKQGIRGKSADALIEEWTDHLNSHIDELLLSGYDDNKAKKIALDKLGHRACKNFCVTGV
ncbi:hypothetical protein MLD52_22675 [Puniceicoccaceae bacterium K14]|nr:hypothetical protein [Puniceicoccaceae bacterium K14]